MSRGDRFKIGDVVQKVRNLDFPGGDNHEIGRVSKITDCEGDGIPWINYTGEGSSCIDDRCWELEIVAKSPLFAALE